MSIRLLVFAPTRRAPTETFVRANLQGLPFEIIAYFGDERPLSNPGRLAYGIAIFFSKALTRLGFLQAATLPGSLVALLLIRFHQPDVLMAEFGFHGVRVMEAAAWSGIPLVVHFRGSDASAQNRLGLLKQRYRRLMAIVSGVIVKSQPMRRTLLALGASDDHLIVSPSGADQRLFYGADPGCSSPLFVAVGRFVAKKGPLQTIHAFAAMRQSLPKAEALTTKLVMVGDGPLLVRAQKLVEELGLGTAVSLPGQADREEVAHLLRRARCFVQHSLLALDGDSEGSPVAVLEAMLSGLPIVSTRHGGIPEVVQESVSGFLVDEGDVHAMAMAMVRIAQDPVQAAQMGAAGKKRVSTQFTVRHHLSQVSELVQRLVHQHV